MAKIVISASQAGSWQKCPRKYLYQYGLGRIQRHESDALGFGSVWHELMEGYWVGESKQSLAQKAMKYEERLGIENACKMAVMLKHYRPPIEDFSVEGVELELEVPIINPHTMEPEPDLFFHARLDLLLVDKDGRIWICDHKTTGQEVKGFSRFWQQKALDRQLGWYLLAIPDAAGFIYDVARKPRHKLCGKDGPKDAPITTRMGNYMRRLEGYLLEDHAQWFQFREMYRSQRDVDFARFDLWATAKQIQAAAELGLFPRHPDSCRSPFTCDYIDVCTGCEVISNDEAFRDRKRGEWMSEDMVKGIEQWLI